MNSLEIKYQWIDVQISLGYKYQYPDSVSAYMKEQCCRPAVYRWMVWKPTTALSAIYVGETDELARRITHYLAPGKSQATNLRLKAYFDNALKASELIHLQSLTFEPFQINEIAFSMDLIGHAHVRRMLENLMLVHSHSDLRAGRPLILNRVLSKDLERIAKDTGIAMAQLRKLGLGEQQAQAVFDALKIVKR